MWAIIVRALAWLAPVAIGWTGSDIYNEAQTTGQLTLSGAGNSAKKSLLSKWWFYALILAIFVAIIWIIKYFRFGKYFKPASL